MSIITNSYGVVGSETMSGFNAKNTRKYVCEVVQGEVSNLVRQEVSLTVPAGAEFPTGTIVFVGANNVASLTKGDNPVPHIVFVGTEHENVNSELGNSGCGLITAIPLNVPNVIVTSVITDETFTVGAKVYANADGELSVTAEESEIANTFVGIVRAVGKHHTGPKTVMFMAGAELN